MFRRFSSTRGGIRPFFRVARSVLFGVATIAVVSIVVSSFSPFAYASAGIPRILNSQGRLLAADGSLLGGAGTDYCFKFSLYDNPTPGSGSQVWPAGSPSTMTVPVKGGVYSVGVGDTNAGGDVLDYNFQDNDAVYLNVEVATKVGATCAPGDGAESFETLSPRQRIFASGYAINSATVGGFTPAQEANANQIPVLEGGNLVLAALNPFINATSSHALTFQGGGNATGDIRFFNSSNTLTSSGNLSLAGLMTASAIASLTQVTIGSTATSTLQGTLTGTSTLQGYLNVLGSSSTSTFSGGVAMKYLSITGTTATSTAATGFDIANGCYAINGSCVGGVNSVTSGVDNSVTVTPNNGDVTVSLNLAKSNTWSALQKFGLASTTVFSAYAAYFGGTATTSIDNAGNVAVAGTLTASGNTTLAHATSTSFAITSVTSTLLKTNASGAVVPAVAGADYLASAVTSLGAAGQQQSGAAQTLATSTNTTNGLTASITIHSSGDTHTFTPSISGTLTPTGGGTGTSTAPTYGQVLLGNGSGGYDLVSTSTLGINNADGTFSTTSADYYAHSSTTIAKTYSANTFTNTNTFNGNTNLANATATNFFATTASSTNLSSQNASVGSLTISSLSGILKATGGVVSTAIAGVDYTNFAYLFPGNATTTTLTFSNGLLSTASTTVGNGTAAGGLTVAGTATSTNLTVSSLTSTLLKTNGLGQLVAAVAGADYLTGANIFGYLFPGNATTTQIAFNGGLTATNATATNATSTTFNTTVLTTANATATNFFATTASSTNLAAQSASVGTLSIGVLGGLLKATAGVVSSAIPGTDYLTSADIFGYLFPGNATTTQIAFNGGLTATTATTTNLTVSSLTSTILKTNSLGQLVAAVAGTDYSTFAYLFPGNATTTQIAFNGGLTATNATTTSATSTNQYVAALVAGNATATNAYAASLSTDSANLGNATATTLAVGNLTGPLQAKNGVLSATGTIGVTYGGTGTSTTPSYGHLLLGNSSGGYDLVATSSLGITSAQWGNITGTLSNQADLQNALDTKLNASAYYSTTTDGLAEGLTRLYYTPARVAGVIAGTTTDALAEGTNNKYYMDTRVNNYVGASTTVAKTYTANTYTALQTLSNASATAFSSSYASSTQGFFGSLSVGSLGGILKATGGLISAAIPGADYLTSADIFGYLFPGNATSTQIAFNGGLTATNATTSNLTVSSLTSTLLKTNNLGQLVAAVAGVDYTNFAYLFPGNATSTQIAFNGGLTTTNATTTNATSTTFNTTTLTATNATTTNLSATSAVIGNATTTSLGISNLNGPLDARNGVVSATSSIGVKYGGTGLTTAPTNGQVLLGNSAGGYDLVSTSTLGINSFSTTSADYYAHSSTTIAKTYSANTFTNTNIFSGNTTLANATSTNHFAGTQTGNTAAFGQTGSTTISSTGAITTPNLLATGSTTLQNVTALNATTTNATTSNFFATTASSTNVFSQSASFGSLAIGALGGLLKATAGVVSAAIPGTDYLTSSDVFGYLFPGNATTTQIAFNGGLTATTATTTNFTISSLTSTILKTNSLGQMVAAVAGVDYSNFAYLFPGNATTTQIAFNGGLTATNATTTNATSTNFFASTFSALNGIFGTLTATTSASLASTTAQGRLITGNIIATSTATSTFAGALIVGTSTTSYLVSVMGSSTAATSATGTSVMTVSNNNNTLSSGTNVLRLNIRTPFGTACTSASTCPRFTEYFAGLATGTDSGGTGVGSLRLSTAGNGITQTSGAADFAEFMQLNSPASVGDLVSLNSSGQYQKAVAGQSLIGVVSDNPAFVGNGNLEGTPNAYVVGFAGVIKTTVSTDSGPISAGDFIAASSTPGVGVKLTTSGYALGQALESFSGPGTGTINVLVLPKYVDAAVALASYGGSSGGESGYFNLATSTGVVSLASSTYSLSLTNATATNSFATTASSTNLFSQSASFGSLSIGTLSGLLKATGGIVSAAIPGTDYLTSANIFGYLFPGNATTTQIAFNGGLTATTATTTNLTVASVTNTILKTNSLGQLVAAVAGVDYANFAYLFPGNATTTLIAFNGGLTTTNATATNVFAGNQTGNTASFGQTGTTSISSTGQLKVQNLNGPLSASNGTVIATTSIGVTYGGTGLSAAPTNGQLLVGNASGGYTLTATSSLGLNSFSTTSADYYTHSSTTIAKTYTANTFTNTNTFNGNTTLANATATNVFTTTHTTNTFAAGQTGTTTISATGAITTPNLLATGSTTLQNVTAQNATSSNATSTNFFATTASSTNLSTANFTLGSINGILKATAGVVSNALVNLGTDVTGILGVANGGTGWAAVQANTLLTGNGSGPLATTTIGSTLQLAASTLGLNLASINIWTGLQQFSGGASSTAFSAINNIYVGSTATTTLQGNTTGTSTFQGFINVAGTNSTSTFSGDISVRNINVSGTATSTFANGITVAGGCVLVNGVCLSNAAGTNVVLTAVRTGTATTTWSVPTNLVYAVVELWGGGGGGGSSGSAAPTTGGTGGTTNFGGLASSTGGTGGIGAAAVQSTGGVGGIGVGGDINLRGGGGGATDAQVSNFSSGVGGNAPRGGMGATSTIQTAITAGTAGAPYGGGGAGDSCTTTGRCGPGGGGGGYMQKVFTASALAGTTTVQIGVGAGGTGGTAATGGAAGGNGGAGGYTIYEYTAQNVTLGNGTVNSGTTGQIAYYNSNGTAVSGSSALYIDQATGKVGIASTSPSEFLSVTGNALISGTSSSANLVATGTLAVTGTSTLGALNAGTTSLGNATSTNFFATTASSTNLFTSNFSINTLTGILKATAGVVSTAVAGVDYANFAYLFPGNATTTLIAFNGGLTTTNATATNVFAGNQTGNTASFGQTGTTSISSTGQLKVQNLNGPLSASNGTVIATTSIGVTYGGTGLSAAPTNGQLLVGNASGGYTLTATSSLGLNSFSTTSADYYTHSSTTIAKTYTANTFTALQTFGNATATNISSTYASSTQGFFGALSVGALGGILKATNGLVSSAIAGVDYTNFAYLFPGNATSTTLSFTGGLLSTASTTIGNGTAQGGLTVAGTATSTNLTITGLTSTLLKTNTLGQLVAAVAGTDYLTSANIFGYLFPGNATTTQIAFNGGLTATNATTTNATSTTFNVTTLVATNATSTTHFAGTQTGNTAAFGQTGSTTIASSGALATPALNVTGNTTLANATSTNHFAATQTGNTASFGQTGTTSISSTGAITTPNLTATGSTTLQNVTAQNATSTNATSTTFNATTLTATNATATNFFATTASSTNLSAQSASFGSLSIGTLSGLLKATGGIVSAAIPGTDYLTSANIFGYLFPGNATTTQIAFNGGLTATTATTTNLTVASVTNTILKTNSLGQLVAAVAGVDYANFAYLFPGNATTTLIAFNGGLTTTNATATNVFAGNQTGNTASFGQTGTTSISSTGQLKVQNLNGPLSASNGTVIATTSIGVTYGGTGLSAAPTNGQLLVGNASGGYTLTATSSLGLNSFSTTSADYYTHSSTTIAKTYTANTFTNTNTFTGATNLGNATATNVGITGTASSTNLVASNSFTFGSGNGILKAISGVVSSALVNLSAAGTDITGVLGVVNGGTGWANIQANTLVTGNGSGAVATTTVGGGLLLGGGSLTLNLASANVWTGLQSYSNASSTLISVFSKAYFGGTATTTIDSAGNVVVAGTLTSNGTTTFATTTATNLLVTASTTLQNFTGQNATTTAATSTAFYVSSALRGAGLTACANTTDKLLWNSTLGQFSCGVDAGAGTGIANLGAAGQLQNGSSQTFATSTDANIGLTITSALNVHTFTTIWNGILSVARGGTGWANIQANTLLTGNGSGALATTTIGSSLQLSAATLSLNLANANLWTGLQTFNNASTTLFESINQFARTIQSTSTNALIIKTSLTSTAGLTLGSTSTPQMLAVDTLNNRITVGPGTGVPTVLVLDTKNTTGDPTGTPGGLYYNSVLGDFRCFNGAVWRGCSGLAASSTGDVQFKNTDGSFTATANFNYSLANNGLTIKGNAEQTGDLFTVASSTGTSMFAVSSAGVVEMATTSDPATPSSGVDIYAKEIAGRVLPKWVGPSGIDTPFQANLGFNRTAMILSAGGTTLTTAVGGFGTAFTNVGTVANPTPLTTNMLTSTRRTTFSTGAVAGSLTSHRQSTLMVTRGNASNVGGFFYTIRFGTSATVVGNRMFIGLADSVAAPTNVDPTTTTAPGKVGMAINANTGNWKFVWNVTGTAPTVSDLGASFPVDNTSLYELIMFSKQNGSAITWRVTNLSTGAQVSSTTATTNIPANTTFLAPLFWATNNATAAAAIIDFGGWYIESDQ